MPLLTSPWTTAFAAEFVSTKEKRWRDDGLGHWAFLQDGRYVGWGGFEKDGPGWDLGLVLKPERFGLGPKIFRKALAFARSETRISSATLLLAPNRRSLRALDRVGAVFVGERRCGGADFLEYAIKIAR